MHKIVVNLETGEQETVELTPDEIAEVEAAQIAGEEAIASFVPEQVPMWAVRTVLQNDGLFDQAQTLINSSTDNALKNVWEYGNFASRNSASIISLATALGLTSEQVDQMFRDANSIIV